MECNYIIYKVENLKNSWVYIGSTSSSIEERKQDHLQKAESGSGHYFHDQIATYGPEAFNWKQIDTAASKDRLALMEKEYILEYNSFEKGYNSDSGGGFKKTVHQYDLEDGSLVAAYDCLDSAADAVNANKKAISKACLNVNNLLNGYYWSYELKEPFVPNIDARRKMVVQMDLDGNIIAEFKSVTEAANLTGANKSSIAKCCRNKYKSAFGFKWKYKE